MIKKVASLSACICFAVGLVCGQNQADSVLIKRATEHYNTAKTYLRTNGDSARHFLSLSLADYRSLNDSSKIPTVLKTFAYSFIFENRLDSAIVYSQKAVVFFEATNDTLNTAFLYNNLGLLNINSDKYHDGSVYLLKALQLKEALLAQHSITKLDIASTQLNIGVAFHQMEKYNQAEAYYVKSLGSAELQNNAGAVAKAHLQLANVFYDTKQIAQAIEKYKFLDEGLYFDGDIFNRAKLYNNYGLALKENKQLDEAKRIIEKAYKMNLEINNLRSAVKNQNNLAQIALAKNSSQAAIKHARNAFDLSEVNGFLSSKLVASQLLGEAYTKLGQYKNAVEYYQQQVVLNDSIYSIDKNRIISEMEAKYESEKKQKEIEYLTAEQRIKDLSLQQKTLVNRWTMIGLAILTAVLIAIVLVLRKVQKQRKQLDEQNIELTKLNNGLQKMFAIISHDMRNFVNGFKSSGKLLAFYIREGKTEKLVQLGDKLGDNSERLSQLLDNLLNWGVTQSGLYKPQKTRIQLSQLIDNQIDLVSDIAQTKGIKLTNKIPAEYQVEFDSDNLNFIVRNLLSNAVKFTENGEIDFSLAGDNSKPNLVIRDNGTGIPEEKLESLFIIKKGKTEKGTAGEKGSGLGLKLVKDFVELNGATIKVKSKLGEGTRFVIGLS